LATGGTDRPRRLGIPGEDLPHVDHLLREPHRYFGRRVLIVGGRNSAVEAALRLYHSGAQVSLSYRQSEFNELGLKYWLTPEIRGLIASGKIVAYFGTHPRRITESQAVLATNESTNEIEVSCDNVLVQIGYEQEKSLMQQVGIDLIGENLRPSFDENTMETNVPAVYVAGTAIAGTQVSSYKIFLENCHGHAAKIAAHLSGQFEKNDPQIAVDNDVYEEPES
jgi:thioredoxin reductase (NADPH)